MTDELAPVSLDHERLDDVERAMLASAPAIELPLVHRFTPGLYTREIFMPAGTLATSKIHNTEHPYVVLTGRARVFVAGECIEEIVAPYVGITKPGTRRLLYIVEDCRWLTFHANPEDESLEQIEERIIEPRELEPGKRAFDLYTEKLERQRLEADPPAAIEAELADLPAQLDYGGAP